MTACLPGPQALASRPLFVLAPLCVCVVVGKCRIIDLLFCTLGGYLSLAQLLSSCAAFMCESSLWPCVESHWKSPNGSDPDVSHVGGWDPLGSQLTPKPLWHCCENLLWQRMCGEMPDCFCSFIFYTWLTELSHGCWCTNKLWNFHYWMPSREPSVANTAKPALSARPIPGLGPEPVNTRGISVLSVLCSPGECTHNPERRSLSCLSQFVCH